MTKEEIQKIADDALQKGKKLKLTFKKNAIADVAYLLGMHHNKQFTFFYPVDYVVLMAVEDSGTWEDDMNRIVTLVPDPKFNTEWFAGRMVRAAEKLELVG